MHRTPAFDAIDHLHVYVNDRAAAEAWYGRVLGLHRLEAYAHWATAQGPLTLSDPDQHLHLALFQRTTGPCHSTIALRVSASAFQAWQAHLEVALPGKPQLADHGEAVSMYFSEVSVLRPDRF